MVRFIGSILSVHYPGNFEFQMDEICVYKPSYKSTENFLSLFHNHRCFPPAPLGNCFVPFIFLFLCFLFDHGHKTRPV